jgi:hypothetical protein
MSRLSLLGVAVAGWLFVGTGSASAGPWYGGGYPSSYGAASNFGHGYGHARSYSAPVHQHYRPAPFPTYHSTNHYDYHAPSVQWHGNHSHFTPSHYDYHRIGHLHHR